MLARLVRWISRHCDRYLERQARKVWRSENGCDSSCSICGYLCSHCGRPS
jgi:hypothetical protein